MGVNEAPRISAEITIGAYGYGEPKNKLKTELKKKKGESL